MKHLHDIPSVHVLYTVKATFNEWLAIPRPYHLHLQVLS